MIFEQASRSKLRFATNKGLLSTEDLWDLSLTSLDTLAKGVNKKLKEESEESFLTTVRSKSNTELELSLDILKHIIQTKQAEQQLSKDRATKLAELSTLKELLANKQMQELSNLSVEEIQQRIALLG